MPSIAELHSSVIHFPIALLTFYVLTELINIFVNNDKLKFTAQVLLIAGVISALAAVLTGNQAQQVATKIIENNNLLSVNKALEQHEQYATALLWYFVVLLVIRTSFIIKKKFTGYRKYFIAVLSIIGLYFIFLTGKYGGELVYKHSVGTNTFNEKITE